MEQSPLNCADEVEIFLNDQDLWCNAHFPKGVFPHLVTLGQNIKDRAVEVALLTLLIVLDTLINRLGISKTNLTNALALQQLLRLEETLIDQVLEPIKDQIGEIRNFHPKRYLYGFVKYFVNLIIVENFASYNIFPEHRRDDHGINILVI